MKGYKCTINGTDFHTRSIDYSKSKTIIAPDWNPTKKCGEGIHFFNELENAVNFGASLIINLINTYKVFNTRPGKLTAKDIRNKMLKNHFPQETLARILEDGEEPNLMDLEFYEIKTQGPVVKLDENKKLSENIDDGKYKAKKVVIKRKIPYEEWVPYLGKALEFIFKKWK